MLSSKAAPRSLYVKPIDRRQIETLLRERREELEERYGVVQIGIFGSAARGDAKADSDVDILVEFDRSPGFFRFLELEEQLSEWLGVRVDLVTKGALKPHMGKRILEEVIML